MGVPTPELKDRNLAIYRLHFSDGKSFNEIGKMYDLTPQRVNAIVQKLKAKLGIDNTI